jgi:CotH kinase protein/Bacterial Ig domain/Lamin Tail Domain
VLHWFIESPGAADSDAGGRGALFFNGEFYDNVQANSHGQSTRGFPKRSYDFDLPRGHKMKWAEDQPRISDFNFLTTWADKSHMRNVLAFETFSDNGVASHFAFVMRVQQNGLFHSVANFVENGDEEFLDRAGLDPNGALYKMYNSAESVAGAEKKSREQEGTGDLQTLINGMSQGDVNLRQAYMFDNLDLPATVNYLANQTLVANTDCCHKNYYLYHDNDGTGEWQGIPWDQDLSFGRVWTCNTPCLGYYDELTYTNTPLFIGNGNRVFTPIFDTPATRQMYLRRLRTILDSMMQPPGTPATNDFYRLKTQRLRDQIGGDAVLDLAKWGTWGATETITQAVNRIWNEFLPGRRLFLFTNQQAGMGGEIPTAQPSNAVINISTIEFRPANGNQRQEFFALTNPNNYAVDITGWRVGGGVRLTFKGGSVIPANGVAYVSPDRRSFRQRPLAPTGGQRLLVLGDYEGNLNAWGESLSITDARGRLVTSNFFAGNPSPAQQYLRITEIMYNPAPLAGNTNNAQAFEYVELRNISASVTLNLAGVRLTNGVLFNFTGSAVTSLAPGARVLVVANSNAFVARYGASLPVAGQYSGALDSNGEELRLEDSFGEKILEFSYDNDWYPITDGHGFSLVVVNDAAHWSSWGDKAAWRASAGPGGGPGLVDPPAQSIAPIVINEALTHTDLPQVDSIELFNPTGTNVDVGGWFLSDDFDTPRKYRIPSPTILPPGGFVVFTETNFNPMPGVPPSFSLGSDGDQVWLFSGDANTNFTGYLQGWSFDAAQNGVSFGRYVNSQGEAHFVAQSTNSPGASNAYPRVGPVILSEVMFHPPDLGTNDNARDEFIELHNLTASPVKLFDATNILNTWRLRDAVDFDFPTNVTLPAGGRLLIVGFATNDAPTLAAFRATYGLDSTVTILGPWSGKLDNSAETIELLRPDSPNGTNVPYILVEKLAYQDAAPWPVTADGEGASLQRRSITGYGNDVTNWFASAPTPGVTNGFNAPPFVTLTNPPDGSIFEAPVNLALDAAAADIDGTIARVEFFADGVKIGEDTSSPFSIVWSNAPPGSHLIYAKARDNALGSATSATNSVTILSRPPMVAIVSPTNHAQFLAGSTVAINVTATDPDGTIALVEFFAGTNKLHETTAQPFTHTWLSAPAGVHALSAIATDNTARRATSAVVTVALSAGLSTNVSLVATGAIWKFFDDGSDQGNAWTNLIFTDATWSNGRSQLGFGDNDETTLLRRTNTVTGGTNITFYFRLKFQVTNASQFSALTARLVRDDGAIGYLNGAEIFRSSMPTGLVNYLTLANVTAGTAFEETNFHPFPFAPPPLVERTNIIAVEVHQVAVNSSDVSFNFELSGTRTLLAPAVVLPPSSQFVPPGSNVTFNFLALGTAPLISQWRFNGMPISGATNATLAMTNVQLAQAGAYDVVVTNSIGSTTSAVAFLMVNRPPIPGTDGMAVLINEAAVRSASSLLTNDTDPDGDLLTLLSITAASTNGATVSLAGDVVTYSPLPNFTGADLFSYTAADGRGATATGRVEILVVTAPLPSVNQIVFVPAGGDRRVRFLGNGGQPYTLQRSTNLVDWIPLHSTVAAPHGIIEYLDAAPPAGQAFYRTASP